MRVTVVSGGVRSGKSRYAERRALEWGGDRVTFVATGIAVDDEMARRIARHRDGRPRGWSTIEAPRNVGHAIREAVTDVVLVDCFTVLLANALVGDAGNDEDSALQAMADEAEGVISAARSRDGSLLMVTNEVGLGVHPPTAIGRWFRDGLGLANQRLAREADEFILMISGLELRLK